MTENQTMREGAMVEMYVDAPSFGSGFRRFIVLEIRRSAVRLFYPPAIRSIMVGRHLFEKNARAVAFNKRQVCAIIGERIKYVESYLPGKRLNSIKSAKAALKLLRAK